MSEQLPISKALIICVRCNSRSHIYVSRTMLDMRFAATAGIGVCVRSASHYGWSVSQSGSSDGLTSCWETLNHVSLLGPFVCLWVWITDTSPFIGLNTHTFQNSNTEELGFRDSIYGFFFCKDNYLMILLSRFVFWRGRTISDVQVLPAY